MARSRKLRPAALGSVERLEKRQVMTAGVATANLLPGGLLKITGTSNAESVTISRSDYDRSVLIVSLGPGRGELGKWNVSAVRAIDASMGAGNDSLTIDFKDTGALGAVKIDMGAGSLEEVRVYRTSLKTLDVNAKDSINTTLRIDRATIASKAFADFGSGQGKDRVFVESSSVGTIELKMGDGDDTVDVKRSDIRAVAIDMGGGDRDIFSTLDTTLATGTVDGGAGKKDAFRGPRFNGVRFINFEDVPRS